MPKQARPPRFLLHGIWGVYNFGCEAIVRGTVQILRAKWPNAHITYASARPIEDGQALRDIELEVARRFIRPRRSPRGLAKTLLDHVRPDWADMMTSENIGLLRSTDCVLSIGGDIFTLPPKPYPNIVRLSQIEYGRRVQRAKKPFVLWGASVGPFDEWPAARDEFVSFLSGIDLVTAREPVSSEYLVRIGVGERVVELCDPAFLMAGQLRPGDLPSMSPGRMTLGVNLSPLSSEFLLSPSEPRTAIIYRQAVALATVARELDLNLLLLPHVDCMWDLVDDDCAYLAEVRGLMIAMGFDRTRVEVLPRGLGAIRTKGVIGQCDALIAARMHCAIAGVSSGVPTVFLAYSPKATGMALKVYGDDQWVISLSDVTPETLVDRLNRLLSRREEISVSLRRSLTSWREEALASTGPLARILNH